MFKKLTTVLLGLSSTITSLPDVKPNCPTFPYLMDSLIAGYFEENHSSPPGHNSEYFVHMSFSRKYYYFTSYYCPSGKDCPWENDQNFSRSGYYHTEESYCTENDVKFNLHLRGQTYNSSDTFHRIFTATIGLDDPTIKELSLQEVGKPVRNHVLTHKKYPN